MSRLLCRTLAVVEGSETFQLGATTDAVRGDAMMLQRQPRRGGGRRGQARAWGARGVRDVRDVRACH